ncbi:MAG: hypothetical protein Q8L24_00830 [bacterium]|nr:hypothetical protein [bacterium]
MARLNDDEDVFDIPPYKGPRDCCNHCKKKFQWGDIITVSEDGLLVFCLCDLTDIANSGIPCLLQWVRAHNQLVLNHRKLFYEGM